MTEERAALVEAVMAAAEARHAALTAPDLLAPDPEDRGDMGERFERAREEGMRFDAKVHELFVAATGRKDGEAARDVIRSALAARKVPWDDAAVAASEDRELQREITRARFELFGERMRREDKLHNLEEIGRPLEGAAAERWRRAVEALVDRAVDGRGSRGEALERILELEALASLSSGAAQSKQAAQPEDRDEALGGMRDARSALQRAWQEWAGFRRGGTPPG